MKTEECTFKKPKPRNNQECSFKHIQFDKRKTENRVKYVNENENKTTKIKENNDKQKGNEKTANSMQINS